MDFHSLLRRDLQFLCKMNKIPANMTNLAMADALKSLETVEGLDEYMSQSDSNVLQSPTTVAKLPPSTAARTTRRKTAVKPEPQSSRLTSKSLDGEMDQEDMMNKNVSLESKANNAKFEAKTPAARSTRKVSAAAASCMSKVQESKKGDLVQSGYSTRRSTRLLEKCMADLSLKTKETLDKPEKIEEINEKNPAGSEEIIEDAEVILGRDLSASMEKEWEVLKNDDDIPVLEHANTETTNDINESKNSETFESLVLTEEVIQENVSEPEKANSFDEEAMGDETDVGSDSEAEPEKDNSGVASNSTISEADSNQGIEEATQENECEAEKIITLDEDTMVETDGGSESEQEGDGSGSNQSVQGTAPTSPRVLEEALVETTPSVAESVSTQFPRPNKSASKNLAMKLVNVDDTSKENSMEMMMMNVVNGESKDEAAKKNKKVEIDEENLKGVSMRKLVKMVKKLSIKNSNNRTALQTLPGNNQIAE